MPSFLGWALILVQRFRVLTESFNTGKSPSGFTMSFATRHSSNAPPKLSAHTREVPASPAGAIYGMPWSLSELSLQYATRFNSL
jgi:hypothetical protein